MSSIIKDFKGNLYAMIDIREKTTLLRCVNTGAHIVIRNHNWSDIGFLKP